MVHANVKPLDLYLEDQKNLDYGIYLDERALILILGGQAVYANIHMKNTQQLDHISANAAAMISKVTFAVSAVIRSLKIMKHYGRQKGSVNKQVNQ